MAYNLQTTRAEFKGGKNILASEHSQNMEAGATLDATKFPTGYNELGLLIARNVVSGKFEKFTAVAGFDNFAILNIDFNNDGENDTIVGEVIIRGSVYKAKLPVAPSAEFRAANELIRFVEHI